ncbi:MAG: hypothetical protein V3U96_01590 [Paracoccaceae bacterium]
MKRSRIVYSVVTGMALILCVFFFIRALNRYSVQIQNSESGNWIIEVYLNFGGLVLIFAFMLALLLRSGATVWLFAVGFLSWMPLYFGNIWQLEAYGGEPSVIQILALAATYIFLPLAIMGWLFRYLIKSGELRMP